MRYLLETHALLSLTPGTDALVSALNGAAPQPTRGLASRRLSQRIRPPMIGRRS